MINLVLEKENQRVEEIFANLSRLAEEENISFMEVVLDPDMIYVPDEEKPDRNKYLVLRDFLQAKKLEGCTNETIRSYYTTLLNYINNFDNLLPQKATTQNIRFYLSLYGSTHSIKNIGLDSIRRTLSTFYSWLKAENYMKENPMERVKRIKTEHTIKTAFTDEEVTKIRDASKKNVRDRAIIDFLLSSGVRVSELCMLNKDDINLTEREGICFGKGQKERFIYFDARTKLHLEDYLNSRVDENPALFVRSNYPFKRLGKGGVEHIVRQIGLRAGVANVHPHRFRRTLATKLLDRGVPLEQVQQILGHAKVDTTLLYALVNQNTVKISHRRYI